MASTFGSVLRIRNFLLLTLATTMSQLGDRLTHMLLITLIALVHPGKLLAYSSGSLAFALPTLMLSPIAGVLVDRWDKRRVLTICHFIQAATLFATPFLISLMHSFVPFWAALVIFFGLDLFNNTAHPALLPALLERRQLLVANSVNLGLGRIATVIGMVVGGFLIKWVGWRYGIMLDSSCHLIAGLLALNIVLRPPWAQSPSRPQVREAASLVQNIGNAFIQFFRELVELFRLVASARLVAFALASITVPAFISAVSYTVLIFLVQQVLRLGTAGVGIFAGILAVGMIGGAGLMGLVPQNIDRARTVIAIILLYGTLFLIGRWLITLWFMVLVALVAGVAFSWLNIIQSTLLQEEVPAEIRGRIFSTREFITNAVFLISTLFIGTVGDLTSCKTALTVIGAILILLGIAGSLWLRGIRTRPEG